MLTRGFLTSLSTEHTNWESGLLRYLRERVCLKECLLENVELYANV